jgi:hypothetical protein
VREQIFSTLKKPRCKGLIQIATNRFFLMTAEHAWFDRSRSLTAGFLDGLQFRARRGITMNGIRYCRAS